MKRFVSFMLCLSVLATFLVFVPTASSAAYYVDASGDWEYTILEDGTAQIKYYRGENREMISIPGHLDGCKVTVIGMRAFYRQWNPITCTTIVIPNTVTTVKGDAFTGCIVSHIFIPDSVEVLGAAFCGLPIEDITIPDSVTFIADYAFDRCTKLKEVNLAPSYYEVTNEMFRGCTALETIDISGAVTRIGARAFEGCTALRSVTIAGSEKELQIITGAFDGCTALKSVTLPERVTEIERDAFRNCTALPSVTLPDTVKQIGVEVFENCTSLKSVKLSASLEEVNAGSFRNCTALTSVDIPASVDNIDTEAFYNCTSLQSVRMHEPLRLISDRAFQGCTLLSSVDLPDSLDYIGTDAFLDCPMESVTITSRDAEIYEHAFGYRYVSETEEYVPLSNFTVYGYKETDAERYANENGFQFVALDDQPVILGDPDGDGAVTVIDATKIQKKLAGIPISGSFNALAADIMGDGLDIIDATYIQKYLAHLPAPEGIGEAI